jgi:hypothetical protein
VTQESSATSNATHRLLKVYSTTVSRRAVLDALLVLPFRPETMSSANRAAGRVSGGIESNSIN